MAIRTRVEKPEAAAPSRNVLRGVVLLFNDDACPVDGENQPHGRGAPIYIQIVDVVPAFPLLGASA